MKNILLLLFLFLVFGCNRTLTSLEYAPATASKGIYYNLPKSVVKVEIDYTVKRDYNLVNGVKDYQGNSYASIEAPVRISTIAVPDTSQRYILTYKKHNNNYFFDDNYSVEVGADARLKAVNWETENVIPDIMGNLVSTGLNVFKTLTQAKGDSLKSLTNDGQELIADYEAEILRLDGKILEESTKSKSDLKPLIKQQELLTLRVAKLKLLYKKGQKDSKKISQTVYINLEKDYSNNPFIKKTTNGGLMQFEIDLKSRFKGITEETFPTVRFSLPKPTTHENGTEGIRYRIPEQVTYNLDIITGEERTINKVAVADLSLIQYGDVNAFPMKAKGSKKSKIALTIDEKTGLITKVSNTSNSILKSSSELAKTASGEIFETFDNYSFNKAKRELENEEALLKLMDSIEQLNAEEPAVSEIEKLIEQLQLQYDKLLLEQQIRELQAGGQ